jgi:hypothetical protein
VTTRRKWWLAISTLIGLAVAGGLILAATVPLSSDAVRHRLVAALADKLDSDIDLGSLSLTLAPRLHIEGEDLIIRRRHSERDRPPLISIKRFVADAGMLSLMRKHVEHVRVEGLDIQIPPNTDHGDDDPDHPNPPEGNTTDTTSAAESVVVDLLEAHGARLAIQPSDPDKPSKVWTIQWLRMRNVGVGQRMPFEAQLTNAVPPGDIQTAGAFGPWRRDNPGRTPLDGRFDFENADLSVFHGISGMLSARGTFGGELSRIDVNGETDTPQFAVTLAGHPVPLHAKYHSIVDATNGNTILERIDASFLNTSLVAKGSVAGVKGRDGRTVTLDIKMERARIEDVMKLAVKPEKSPMSGALQLTTHFVLPPGHTDVVDRLQLAGTFKIGRARFANYDVQAKVNELSHRGRGLRPDDKKESVVSNMRGGFKLLNGRLELAKLGFDVPGAEVALDGRYALRREVLDFKGTLLMDAKVSDTQSGFKRVLLKAIDPLFSKEGGGSAIPIKISGTRNNPQFGLDLGRVFKRKDS